MAFSIQYLIKFYRATPGGVSEVRCINIAPDQRRLGSGYDLYERGF
jgi:hypothetical protein